MRIGREQGGPSLFGVAQPSRVPDGAKSLYECQFGGAHLGSVWTTVARIAGAHGLTDRSQFNFIVVNELTTNAVLHGGGGGRVRLWLHDDALWCEIVDTGRGIPALRQKQMREPGPGAHGHGLWLAHHICADLHMDTGRRGTRVLLRYPLGTSDDEQ